MSTLGKLTVYLNGDASSLNKSIQSAQSRLSGFATGVQSLLYGAGIGMVFNYVINAMGQQEAAVAQLNSVLESTHMAAGLSSEELQNMAASLSKVSTEGDEAIIRAEALLLTFTGIKGEVFKEATQTILDMSAALGQDLKSSAIQLGKALNDPVKGITALSRVGVSFTESQKEMITNLVATGKTMEAQRVILTELKTEFGGMAGALSDTVIGKFKLLWNAVSDFAEQVGELYFGQSGEGLKLYLQTIIDLLDSTTRSLKGLNSALSYTSNLASDAFADFLVSMSGNDSPATREYLMGMRAQKGLEKDGGISNAVAKPDDFSELAKAAVERAQKLGDSYSKEMTQRFNLENPEVKGTFKGFAGADARGSIEDYRARIAERLNMKTPEMKTAKYTEEQLAVQKKVYDWLSGKLQPVLDIFTANTNQTVSIAGV